MLVVLNQPGTTSSSGATPFQALLSGWQLRLDADVVHEGAVDDLALVQLKQETKVHTVLAFVMFHPKIQHYGRGKRMVSPGNPRNAKLSVPWHWIEETFWQGVAGNGGTFQVHHPSVPVATGVQGTQTKALAGHHVGPTGHRMHRMHGEARVLRSQLSVWPTIVFDEKPKPCQDVKQLH
jgi:hypothetical protein